MGKYLLTKKAVEDLSKIWGYTFETWSERQADKYYSELLYSCKTLAENPLLGKGYDELGKGILGYKINNHIIFYRAISKLEIEIIRVLHGKMDFERQLKK